MKSYWPPSEQPIYPPTDGTGIRDTIYFIYKSSEYYYAVNVQSGLLTFSNTDRDALILDVVDNEKGTSILIIAESAKK